MRLASIQTWLARRDVPLVDRIASLALVIALHFLLLLLLVRLAPPPPPFAPPPGATMVELIPAEKAEKERARASTVERERTREDRRVAAPPPTPLDTTTMSDERMAEIWSRVLPMTREQMATADLKRFPSRPRLADNEGATDSGAATALAGDPGPGAGPNGEPLWNAEWYRKPTHAELSTYLPARAAGNEGWGMIACQTIADYRVDNCIEIAQSPAGSGLAGAVRQAAWQFRVMPPRIGGKKLVGAWVRIRIDYTVETPG